MRLLPVFLAITFLYSPPSAAYTDGTVLVLSTGATSLTVSNSGPLGGNQAVTLPVDANHRGKIWFSIPGAYSQRGGESACATPCVVSLNTEYGRVGYLYEITDSSGNPLTPVLPRSSHFLNFPQPPT